LLPGESTTLTINVSVPKRLQRRVAPCFLDTDHPRFKSWEYNLEFVSLPPVVADPDILDLGGIYPGSDLEKSAQNVTINLFSKLPIELAEKDFEVPDTLDLKIVDTPSVRKLQHGIIHVRHTLSIALKRGRLSRESNEGPPVSNATIHLKSAGIHPWSYTVVWRLLPHLVVSPSLLSFGNVRRADEYVAMSVTIASPNGRSFRLTSVANDCPDLQIGAQFDSTRDAPEHRVEFAIRRYEGSKTGYLAGAFRVETTDRLKRLVTIPWTAVLGPAEGPRRPSNEARQ
jgi:hypothetical protein